MRDLHHNIKATPAIDPGAAITGNSTTDGAIIDTVGFDGLEFVVHAGTITDGTFAVSLRHGDEPDGSDMEKCEDGDLIGEAPTFTNDDSKTAKRIGYRGHKRYVRVRLTQSEATTGGVMSAIAIQGFPKVAPVAE